MGTNAQQFCLKWNNHQANMLSVFDRLLSNKSLVDVTIGCEGRQVKAHKVVLSACSPFFENLFTENPCKHPIVILKDIRYADLKALVEFMYKGEVNVVQEQLPTLLKTAEALKIKGLAEVTGDGKADDKPNASVTPRPDSPGARRKRQRARRKSTDSAAHSDSEESVPKVCRTTEHDDSSMDGATSLDDGSQASVQPQSQQKEPSNVQNNAVTVNNSSPSSALQPNNQQANSTSNGPNSSAKDTDFEPSRLLEASMTTDHGTDNSTELNSTGPDNTLIPEGLDIKPIITLEEGTATPAGAIVPASVSQTLPTGTDAISSLFPPGTGATALPSTSYQASPQSHGVSAKKFREPDMIVPDVEVDSGIPIRCDILKPPAIRVVSLPVALAPVRSVNSVLPQVRVTLDNEAQSNFSRGKAGQFWSYVCNDCTFHTEDYSLYKAHRSMRHREQSLSMSKVCHICNKGFLDIDSHLKVHQHGRRNVCDVCDLGFNSPIELRNHVSKMHHGQHLLKCGYCDFIAVKEEISQHLLHCEPFKLQQQLQIGH